MILTAENYFDKESNQEYMSVSQFKDFMKCEAQALAKLNGDYTEEMSTALLVGSYVDAHFEGTLDIFKAQHQEIFTQKGELRSEYKKAEYIISRIERDEMFMSFMAGEKQVIMTGKICGIKFKIKIDSYFKNGCIVDLKVMKDFKKIWVEGQGKQYFVEAWGYDIQGAVYQEIERQNNESKKPLDFYIAGATKEGETDIAIMSIPQMRLDFCLDHVKQNITHVQEVKAGLVPPTRCGECDYCKKTKHIEEIVSYTEIE